MPAVDIFPVDSMQVFADLIHNQLGVRVRMRGDTIACDFGETPPVIYLPSLEFAKEEDVKALFGFALHEAGHVRYTKFRVIEEVRDYLLKGVQNYFEDEFVERRLRRDFPGGAEYLSFSNAKGYEIAVAGTGGRKLFQASRESFLGNPDVVRDAVARQALARHAGDLFKAGLSPDDADLFDKLSERRDFVAAIAESVGPGLFRAAVERVAGRALGEDEDVVAEACSAPGAIVEALFRSQLIRVREEMERRGVPGTGDDVVMGFLERRLEASRLLWLWSYAWRNGPDEDLRRQFEGHPWRATLDEVNAEPTRSTEHALEKAVAFCEKLGIKPILPGDDRPVDLARELVEQVEDRAKDEGLARKELRLTRREMDAVTREKVGECMEASDLLEAQDEASSANEAVRECGKKLAKARARLKDAKDALKKVRERLAKERRALREATREAARLRGQAENAEDASEKERLSAEADEMDRRAERLSERCAHDESLMARREEAVEFCEMQENEALADSTAARLWHLDAKNAEADARSKLEDAKKEIAERVKAAYAPQTAPLEAALAEKEKATTAAEAEANAVLGPMRDKDADSEAQIAPGVVGEILQEIIEKVRSTSLDEELGEAVRATMREGAPEDVVAARMYQPFDRSADSVDEVAETPDGREDYALACLEYKDVIDETTERLRKLYSPERNRIKVNVPEGRLDPRKAYKIGLALRGVPQDLSRVWKDVQTRKDPKVAVSLLIDCSGSMAGPSIALARAAACALSEVMRGLCIPHEIVGHTTGHSLSGVGLSDAAECERVSKSFSRVLPFQGYVFKRFEDNNPPASVFTDVGMHENLDGEAVTWALQRLAVRREKTKICIAICDGLPNAAFSRVEELERHLFATCKRAEAKEREGVHLCAIGIGVENVRQYYKNADVINEISELPKAVLTIVEGVIEKTGMA